MKKKVKIGYKALTLRIGGLQSWSASSQILTYSYDKWTERPKDCGPLAVFTSFEEAHRFVTINDILPFSNSTIVKCEYVPSKNKTLWKSNGSKYKHSLPWGTALAEKVKLIK